MTGVTHSTDYTIIHISNMILSLAVLLFAGTAGGYIMGIYVGKNFNKFTEE